MEPLSFKESEQVIHNWPFKIPSVAQNNAHKTEQGKGEIDGEMVGEKAREERREGERQRQR